MYASELGTEIVTIYVGAKRKEFLVHKKLLCKKVEYFNKMFNGGFREAREAIAYMSEDDPAAFSLLVRWVYRDTIPDISREEKHGENKCEYDDILDLYLLAHKLNLEKVADVCMDLLIDDDRSYSDWPGDEHIQKVYDNTAADSALRRYCLRVLQWYLVDLRGLSDSNRKHVLKIKALLLYHEDILIDFLTLMKGTNSVCIRNPTKDPRCDYHVHGKHEECLADYEA